jgi:hypothetical protein
VLLEPVDKEHAASNPIAVVVLAVVTAAKTLQPNPVLKQVAEMQPLTMPAAVGVASTKVEEPQ